MINIIDNSEVDAEVRAISLNHVPKTAPTEMQKNAMRSKFQI